MPWEKVRKLATIIANDFGLEMDDLTVIFSDKNLPKYIIKENKINKNDIKDSSEILTIYEFVEKYTNNYIPLFQRKYVWNQDAIKAFLNSLLEDCSEKKKSYLNNILLTKNGDRYNIIDGQQRTFTMVLILYTVFKKMSHKKQQVSNIFKKLFESRNCDGSIKFNWIENVREVSNYTDFEIILNKWNSDNSISNLLLVILSTLNDSKVTVEQFYKHILFDTILTTTILYNKDDDKLFANLNTLQVPLNALDLVRNYVYTLSIKNPKSSTEQANKAIKNFNSKIEKMFLKKNGEIDVIKFRLFTENLVTKLNLKMLKSYKSTNEVEVAKSFH
ncbi:DUF262 domain-containing protein [Mycoplasmopsis alligatoris]|uniref:GmrSD restriction endonucleases N-terminal domain-containing protein n=1 Tax=Mycoplasmopsis alligatoris A21JP2 TaxID=747682 RepID=D4XX37_9BACT|nr:DUF262 domain-containing protein [Mycoplasmopsis alligatoris]EFF41099.1 conserved hypothetical protein [Mycoplasmopsis alligatoris A21JP2]